MTALLVLAGGAIGAPARYLIDLFVQSRHRFALPLGTLGVNALGSFALGLLASLSAHGELAGWVLTLAGTGFCGALTTFSTFSFETLRLVESGRAWAAAGNVALSLGAGLAAVCLGWWLGSV